MTENPLVPRQLSINKYFESTVQVIIRGQHGPIALGRKLPIENIPTDTIQTFIQTRQNKDANQTVSVNDESLLWNFGFGGHK